MNFPLGLDLHFLYAARRGDIRRLQSLVEEFKGFPFAELLSPKGENALHSAAVEGKTSTCRYLIEELHFNINGINEDGETPLFLALMGMRRPTTIYLINNGADVTHCNTLGVTPLHCVAERGTREMVDLLISRGADVRATSQRGTPLHFGARGGNRDVLGYLLDVTADPHPNISSMDQPPLFSALLSGSVECVDLLLKAGADPNYQCFQLTPLLLSVAEDERLIRCLLDNGADPNIPDSVGYTPLDHAAMLGRREVVTLLFPHTSPIASYPDWSINGIMQHAKSREARLLFNSKKKEIVLLGKTKGKEAFERKQYTNAYNWFAQAFKADPLDAQVLSNMSLCSVKFNYGPIALKEAQTCIKLEPRWAKAHYREGAAYMVLKDFKEAAKSFSQALALEPGNKEIEKAHRAALAEFDKFSHWNV